MSEKLNYYQLGNGPNDILLIHGLAADSGFWLPLVNYIDKTKYTVNLIDLKGHGKSSFNDVAFLPSVLSLEVVELIETREYSNLILVGHSFGGRVVLNMLPNMAKH
ncbi:alpha/beta hydrolase, partial [Synechococcus sp. AH-229-G18]|nr:alpha/beta hydrolase [Synechococcus sp. AH-229-G18]